MAYCGPSGNGIGPSFPYMGNHHTEMLDLQRHGVGAIIVPQFFSSGWWGGSATVWLVQSILTVSTVVAADRKCCSGRVPGVAYVIYRWISTVQGWPS